MTSSQVLALGLGVIGAAVAGFGSHRGAEDRLAGAPDRPATAAVSECNVQVPIQTTIRPVGAIVRGAPLTVRIEVTAPGGLDLTQVVLASTGGAGNLGSREAHLGRLVPGETAGADFTVQIPMQGDRHLLEFEIRGEGAEGLLARGATFNILPDGPADAGRAVVTPGGRRVVEYAARRIEP